LGPLNTGHAINPEYAEMDPTKYAKYKKYFIDVGLLLAVIIFCTGTVFIGVVIGENSARAAAEKQRTELIASYRETIDTKDKLIATLTASTVKATDAVVSVTAQQAQTVETVKSVVAKSDQVAAAAKTAAHAATEAATQRNAKVAEDAKKLKELK